MTDNEALPRLTSEGRTKEPATAPNPSVLNIPLLTAVPAASFRMTSTSLPSFHADIPARDEEYSTALKYTVSPGMKTDLSLNILQ